MQGTLARQLLDSPSHVITRAGAKARAGAAHARAASAARGALRTAGVADAPLAGWRRREAHPTAAHCNRAQALTFLDSRGSSGTDLHRQARLTLFRLESGSPRLGSSSWLDVICHRDCIVSTVVNNITGYKLIHINARARAQVPLRMSVDAISFSAHADYAQTSQFLAALAPPHVVLVRRRTRAGRRLVRIDEWRQGGAARCCGACSGPDGQACWGGG